MTFSCIHLTVWMKAIAPHLTFRCGPMGCVLAEVWTSEAGYGIPAARVRDFQYLAYVPLGAAGN